MVVTISVNMGGLLFESLKNIMDFYIEIIMMICGVQNICKSKIHDKNSIKGKGRNENILF